jgi:hypothetical protein
MAFNVFKTLPEYAVKWEKTASRLFTAEEQACVSHAKVVPSQYGNSVCFFMKNGRQTFIPLSTESTKGVGDAVDIATAELITLSKPGEKDIIRVEA